MMLALTVVALAFAVGSVHAWISGRAAPLRHVLVSLGAWLLPRGGRHMHAEMLALTSGVAAIAGATFAIELGGEASIAWLWIGTGLAAAWIGREVAPTLDPHHGPATGDAPPLAAPQRDRLASGLSLLLAIASGIGLTTQQTAVAASQLVAVPQAVTVTSIGLIAALSLFGTRGSRGLAVALVGLVPMALTVIVLGSIATAAGDPGATRASLESIWWSLVDPRAVTSGLGGAAWITALLHGCTWSVLTSGAGLGHASFVADATRTGPRLTAPQRRRATAGLMMVPVLGSCLLTTAIALAIGPRSDDADLVVERAGLGDETRDDASDATPADADPESNAPSDDPESREISDETARPATVMRPLERKHSAGFRPSRTKGQLIMLPADTPLAADQHYPMRFRANPRGHKLGRVDAEQNMVITYRWQIIDEVDTIVFRDKHPARRANAGYDLRIAVEREAVTNEAGKDLYLLRPLSPDVDLGELTKDRDGPYVVAGDLHFVGTVGVALDRGEEVNPELAMYEQRQPGEPANPTLMEIVRFGYAGPYFDGDRERAPWAFVAAEGYEPAIGQRIRMSMRTPKRGIAIGERLGSGAIRTPAWDFLAQTQFAVLRHKHDPSADMRVPVEHEFGKDGTLRFRSAMPDIVDFAKADGMKHFTGPYLLPPDFTFEAEVRTGTNFSPEFEKRRALVPLHDWPEPQSSPGALHRPHPYSVAQLGMHSPQVDRHGIEYLVGAVRARLPPVGRWAFVGLCGLLAVAATSAACRRGEYSLRGPAGRGGSSSIRVAILLAGLATSLLPVMTLLQCIAWLAAARLSVVTVGATLRRSSSPDSHAA